MDLLCRLVHTVKMSCQSNGRDGLSAVLSCRVLTDRLLLGRRKVCERNLFVMERIQRDWLSFVQPSDFTAWALWIFRRPESLVGVTRSTWQKSLEAFSFFWLDRWEMVLCGWLLTCLSVFPWNGPADIDSLAYQVVCDHRFCSRWECGCLFC